MSSTFSISSISLNQPGPDPYSITDGIHLDRYGNTALHYAAKEGCEEMVSILLSAYKTPGGPNIFGNTPIQNAAICGHQKVVSIFLRAYRPVLDLENNPSAPEFDTGELDGVLLDTPAGATYLYSLKLAKTAALIEGRVQIAKMIGDFINKKPNLQLLANGLSAAKGSHLGTPFERLVHNEIFEPKLFSVVGKFLSY